MNKIKVIVDSCSSFINEDKNKYDIDILPLYLIMDKKEYDPLNMNISIDEYYNDIENHDIGSSCCNVFTFLELFNSYLDKNIDVIFISLSSGLTSSYQNAINAVEQLSDDKKHRIAVIDSLTGGAGIHFATFEALRLIKEGKSVLEIKDAIDKNKLNVVSLFTIGSLNHLYKGGRLSKAGVVIGNIIKMKPIVTTNELGQLKVFEIHLGKRKAIKAMAELANKDANKNYPLRISYTNNEDEAMFLKDKLLELDNNINIELSRIDYTLGAHCGPLTIAIFYIKK